MNRKHWKFHAFMAVTAAHMEFESLLFSKNAFPQHSLERKARKVLGNWLCLLTYSLECTLWPNSRHWWWPCVKHQLLHPINP